jgi:hypothetical protein
MDNLTETIEGVPVVDESRAYVGTFGSVVLTHAGQAATMGTPHGPAEQELIAKACREGRIAPASVDAIECFADAMLMGDAVEMSSAKKVLCDGARPPLGMTSVKSNFGNGIQGSGMLAIFKVLYGQAYGWQSPSLHLRAINPQVDDLEGTFVNDENVLFPTRTSLVQCNSIGWGGTLGSCICSCGIDGERTAPPKPALEQEPLIFWPGGGGDELAEPTKSYYILGSWSGWEPEAMEKEGPGVYGFMITLGANRYEEFQILYDGDYSKVLHPTITGAPAGSSVEGPDEEGSGCTWAIDGRVFLYSLADGSDMSNLATLPPIEGVAPGSPQPGTKEGYYESTSGLGDQYWVRLSIAGKWRVVTWERISGCEDISEVTKDPVIMGKYYLTANFNMWTFEEMTSSEASPGVYSKEVRMLRKGGHFQICRNKDQSQIFHPEDAGAERPGPVLGPEMAESYLSWSLSGAAGDVFRITFQRVMDAGVVRTLVDWTKVREEPLTPAEHLTARRKRFAIIGTWNSYKEASPMTWNDSAFTYTVEVGSGGSESFQILVEGNAYDRLIPSLADASPHDNHEMLQGSAGNSWAIGVHANDGDATGKKFEVSLLATPDGAPKKVTWKALD